MGRRCLFLATDRAADFLPIPDIQRSPDWIGTLTAIGMVADWPLRNACCQKQALIQQVADRYRRITCYFLPSREFGNGELARLNSGRARNRRHPSRLLIGRDGIEMAF